MIDNFVWKDITVFTLKSNLPIQFIFVNVTVMY